MCLYGLISLGQLQAQAEEIADLSILELRQELTPYMSYWQLDDLKAAERSLERAESNYERGNYMLSRQPSKLRPDEELRQIHKDGKEIVATSKLQIKEAQLKIVELLEAAQTQQAQELASLQKDYAIELNISDVDAAIKKAIDQNLKACWQKGYERILFDAVFVSGVSGTERAKSFLSNRVYEALIKADGERFTVNVAKNLRYQSGQQDDDTETRFRYDHEEAHSAMKVALLRVEFLESPDSNNGFLVMAAMNPKSRETLSRSTYLLSNIQKLLGRDAIAIETNQEARTSLKLTDSAATLDQLAQVADIYRFSIDTDSVVDIWRSLAFYDLIAELIYQNTDIPLNEDRFIERAYEAQPSAVQDKKRVALRLEAHDQGYLLRAEAEGQEHILDVGQVALTM